MLSWLFYLLRIQLFLCLIIFNFVVGCFSKIKIDKKSKIAKQHGSLEFFNQNTLKKRLRLIGQGFPSGLTTRLFRTGSQSASIGSWAGGWKHTCLDRYCQGHYQTLRYCQGHIQTLPMTHPLRSGTHPAQTTAYFGAQATAYSGYKRPTALFRWRLLSLLFGYLSMFLDAWNVAARTLLLSLPFATVHHLQRIQCLSHLGDRGKTPKNICHFQA